MAKTEKQQKQQNSKVQKTANSQMNFLLLRSEKKMNEFKCGDLVAKWNTKLSPRDSGSKIGKTVVVAYTEIEELAKIQSINGFEFITSRSDMDLFYTALLSVFVQNGDFQNLTRARVSEIRPVEIPKEAKTDTTARAKPEQIKSELQKKMAENPAITVEQVIQHLRERKYNDSEIHESLPNPQLKIAIEKNFLKVKEVCDLNELFKK